MSMGANATNPLPEASMGAVIAATKLLGPGEAETIIFAGTRARVITNSLVLSQGTLLRCLELWWLSDLHLQPVKQFRQVHTRIQRFLSRGVAIYLLFL